MATFTNTTKHSVSLSNTYKNSVSLSNNGRAITPWTYNQAGFKYNQVTGGTLTLPIYYNSIGLQAITNTTKN